MTPPRPPDRIAGTARLPDPPACRAPQALPELKYVAGAPQTGQRLARPWHESSWLASRLRPLDPPLHPIPALWPDTLQSQSHRVCVRFLAGAAYISTGSRHGYAVARRDSALRASAHLCRLFLKAQCRCKILPRSESDSASSSDRASLVCATRRLTSVRAASYAPSKRLTRASSTCLPSSSGPRSPGVALNPECLAPARNAMLLAHQRLAQ